ncbi:hypothetical protein CCUS01_01454, partial [Colletotrichum cuscutae]
IKQAAAAAAARLALQPIPKSQGLNAGNSTLQNSTGTHDANEGIQEQIGPEDAATR